MPSQLHDQCLLSHESERAVIGFTFAVFVAADAVLVHIQVHRQLLLRDQFLLSHVIRDPQPVDQRLSAA